MVVLPILLALAATQCDANLQPVTLALQQNDLPKASSLLAAIPVECSASSSFYALTGVTDELSGKTDEAESAFQKAISLDPKSPRLREQLGAAYLRNKKPALAAEELQQAVVLDPANPAARKYLIGAYVETKAWEKAAKLFDQIGEKPADGSDPIFLLWFAQTLMETRQVTRLGRDLPSPNAGLPPPLLFSLGTLFAQHGMYLKAVDYLQAIPENEADDAVYFNLGLAYSHLQKYLEARKYYFLAIDKHPEHADAYFRVGLDYGAAGDSRKALPWLFRAREWAPSRADLSYALVEQLIQLKYFDTAQEILAESAQPGSTSPLLSVATADLKQARGDNAGAIEQYRQLLAQQPDFPPALVGLARADIANGKEGEARSSLRAALSKNPDDPSANGELGLLDAGQGNWNSALPHLEKVWVQDRSDAKIALALSRVYRYLNRPADALRVLTTIAPEAGQSSPFHLELAQVYTQLHQPAKAQAERTMVAQIQTDTQAGLHFDNPKVYVH